MKNLEIFFSRRTTPLMIFSLKEENNMNKLQEIFIRWSTHQVAFHTDVQKLYNSVKLKEEDWCYQRYIWQAELDPSQIP